MNGSVPGKPAALTATDAGDRVAVREAGAGGVKGAAGAPPPPAWAVPPEPDELPPSPDEALPPDEVVAPDWTVPVELVALLPPPT